MSRTVRFELRHLLASGGAGVQVSGDSGTGKSELLRLMMQTLAESGQGFALIDPEGDLASAVEEHAASLPDRIRRKVLVVKPSDPRLQVGVNSLAVPRDRLDLVTWRARRAAKVSHVTQIMLASCGEAEQGLDGRPRLAKYSFLYLNTLAECGLSIPDIRFFFDVAHPVYESLAARAPDFIGRLELAALADMKPREREDLVASCKNRFLGLLENPLVEACLGKLGAVVDVRQLIQEGYILIVNLEPAGVLRVEDVQILANLWLNEILHAIYNTPEAERITYWLFLDELPTFASCSQQLTFVLRTARKHRCHIAAAHQGSQFFEERIADRLLNALVGQCGARVYFRHVNPVDAKFFGEIVKLPTLDPRRVKHELRQQQQYQDGHEVVTLVDESENWSSADQQGSSSASGTSETATDTSGASEAVRTAADAARQDVSARTQSQAQATGTSRTDTSNQSQTNTRGGSRTRKQTLVPRIRTRTIITGVQFFSIEEQNVEGAVELSQHPVGTATLYLSGQLPKRVAFPLAKQPFARTPNFARRKRAELHRILAERPDYEHAEVIVQQRALFAERLVEHLRSVPIEHQPAEIPTLNEPDELNPFAI